MELTAKVNAMEATTASCNTLLYGGDTDTSDGWMNMAKSLKCNQRQVGGRESMRAPYYGKAEELAVGTLHSPTSHYVLDS